MVLRLFQKRVVRWPVALSVVALMGLSLILWLWPPPKKELLPQDLPEIMARKYLVAVVHPGVTSYFIEDAEPSGFQFEMLQAYARYLGLKLTVIPARSLQEGYELLRAGKADLVASDLLVGEPGFVPGVYFSYPYMYSRHVLVQKKPRNWRSLSKKQLDARLVRDVAALSGKKVYTPGVSVLLSGEKRLPGQDMIRVQRLQGVDPERVFEMVSKGYMEYAVVGEHVAKPLGQMFPGVDVATPLSDPIPLGWAVPATSSALLYHLNTWMYEFTHSVDFVLLKRKYQKIRREKTASAHSVAVIPEGHISPFDKHLRVYSAQIGWDWRLVASLMYQESRFDPSARSKAGAFGLMQMMPQTLRGYGLDSLSSAEQQIRAGIRYLKVMEKIFQESVPRHSERVKFVLAAYNIGAGHILDAQRIAKHFGKDPAVWDGSVDSCLLMKADPKVNSLPEVRHGPASGKATFAFVRQVMERYAHYTNIVRK